MRRPAGMVLVLAVAVAVAVGAGCSSPAGNAPPKAAPTSDAQWQRCDVTAPSKLPAALAVQAFEPGNVVESVAGDAGMARDAVALKRDLASAAGDSATTLPHTRALEGRLLDAPAWFHGFVSDVASPVVGACAAERGELLATVVTESDARNHVGDQGTVARRQDIPDPEGDLHADEPLVAAFRRVFGVNTPWPGRPESSTFNASSRTIRGLASALHPSAQRPLAAVVAGMARAEEWRLEALKLLYPNGVDHAAAARVVETMSFSLDWPRRFDHVLMGRAGASLALAAERLKVALVAHPLPAGLDVNIATPLGQVIVRGGSGDDTHRHGAPALVIDAGGNDRYDGVVGGPATASVPLSVVIDLGGDDRYDGGDARYTQGAGALSFGYLIDHAGNDTYRATGSAQGAGFFGVGALLDEGGDDTYEARSGAQGAGVMGIGVAVDLAGRDSWRLTTQGQGFASTRSVGVLLDAGGDDLYEAQDTDITNPSAQTKEHNSSLAQGMGTGQRRGPPAVSLNGGTGMLVDLAGNDRYSCGVFCQGAGYYFGQGVLYDRAGDDSYRGVWYTQGAAAHFAKGALIDDAGSDSYTTVILGSHGEGHDQSAGFLMEGGGDDTYTVPRLSNGAANDAGFGFFVDAAGADRYVTAQPPAPDRFGAVDIGSDWANYRGYEGSRALGVFLDLAGDDRYEGAPAGVGNGGTWKFTSADGSRAPPAGHTAVGRDVG